MNENEKFVKKERTGLRLASTSIACAVIFVAIIAVMLNQPLNMTHTFCAMSLCVLFATIAIVLTTAALYFATNCARHY